MQISSGPFAGIDVPESELELALDRAGNPRLDRNGKPLRYWSAHQRVRRLLEHFRPEDGWCVVVELSPGTFSVPSPSLTGVDGQPVQQPTGQFTAKLLNAAGHAVANAMVVQVLDSLPAWTSGQTRARGALCDALGLSLNGIAGQPEDSEEHPADTSPVAFNVEAVASSAPVAPDTTSTPAPAPAEPAAATSATETPASAVTVSEAQAAAPSEAKSKPQAKTPVVEAKVDAVQQAATAADQPATAVPVTLNTTLLRQARATAKLRGVEVPEFASNDALRDFYKGLVSGKQGVAA